ncbi:MAG: IclR family transcriptional regulator domain-containing protein [Steroidobacteraceae bacterium]
MTESAEELLFRSGDPHLMRSLVRGLHVIQAFSRARQPYTSAELSRVTGLSRAVVRRCLYTLREAGYIEAEDHRYHLRAKVLTLGRSFERPSSLSVVARPVLEELSAHTRGACSVGVLEEGMVLYVARVTSRSDGLALGVGSRTPAYCTAMGRVLLSSLTEQRATAEIAKVALAPPTRFTLTSLQRLLRILEHVRTAGYAVNDRELRADLRAIAVPVRNRAGAVVAAMSVSAPASIIRSASMAKSYLPVLRAASVRLGAQWLLTLKLPSPGKGTPPRRIDVD